VIGTGTTSGQADVGGETGFGSGFVGESTGVSSVTSITDG
jgi:hypothetical protein